LIERTQNDEKYISARGPGGRSDRGFFFVDPDDWATYQNLGVDKCD
jgi:hypothetical protein